MKKIIFSTMAVSALLLTSCAGEDLKGPEADGSVVFSVQLPGDFTRAISDGQKATSLSYAIYLKGEDQVLFTSENVNDPQAQPFSGLKTTLSVPLAKGKSYDIIFWADKPGNTLYDFSPENKNVTITYPATVVGNDEDRDAFFQAVTIDVKGAMTENVELRRPFAQLNFATNDLEAALKAGFPYGGATVKVSNVYNTLNLLTGVATNVTDNAETTAANAISFDYVAPIKDDEGNDYTMTSTDGKTYHWLSMNYLLTGNVPTVSDIQKAESELVDVEFNACDEAKNVVNTISVSHVPVQRNYRTNIYGALLTSTVDFNIEIVPGYYDDNSVQLDNEGFRVANSLQEAYDLLKAGYPEVSVDASMLTQTITRATGEVAFLLNKTVAWQKLKVTGKASVGVKVSYDELTDGTAVEDRKFTLVITNMVPSATIDLTDADVNVKGQPEAGVETVEIPALTIENAASATVSGETKVDEITTGDNFEGDVDFEDNVEITVGSSELLLAAFANEGVSVINVTADINLIDVPADKLTVNGVKTLNVTEGKTITLGNDNRISIYDDFTLKGKGTITNEYENDNPTAGTGKTLLCVYKGNFNASDITLINDREHFYHGPELNSSAIIYWSDANLTLNKVNILSGMFCICGYDRKTSMSVTSFTDCYFWSCSSSSYGTGNWAYALRICGKKSNITNCEVDAIQGCISPEWGVEMTIDGGTYGTRWLDADKKTGNPFDAVYATGGCKVTILDGNFYGPRTAALAQDADGIGTQCIRSGDNDVDYPYGFIYLKGGKFSGKSFNTKTEKVIVPPAGYEYVRSSDSDKDRYPFKVQAVNSTK